MQEKTILIVDDETQVAALLQLVFTRKGYQAVTAASAAEALALLAEQDIPVMFFDLNMPDMDGRDLCRKIKQRSPAVFIVALTGMRAESLEQDCKAAGFDEVLIKPININPLEEVARKAFQTIARRGQTPD